MKFDARVIQILKNFSTINPSIVFKPGKYISTMSQSQSIMGRAEIDQEIEKSFGIHDLSKFISTMSLFSSPDIIIKDDYMVIKEGSRKVNYVFADPSYIVSPPDKEIKFPAPEVSFDIGESDLQGLMKAQSILSLPEIAIVGDGSKIFVKALNGENPTSDVYSLEVGVTEDNFSMVIKAEYLKLLPGDYHVEVSSKGISKFTGNGVEYFIAVDSSSKYGN